MNPLKLSAVNFRSFERLDLELPTGIAVIVGKNPAANNGEGKSSVIDAIDLALFAKRGELAQWLTLGEDELELVLEFEHAGELYRVRHQYSGRGKGKTTLDFEQFVSGYDIDVDEEGEPTGDRYEREPMWQALTRETAAATGELIEETIGLSRTTFRASSFLKQRDGGAFSEATPAARKGVLADILGLSVWDRLQLLARRDLRLCEDELLKSQAVVEGCDQLVEAKPLVERVIADSSARLDTARATLAEGEQQYEAAQAELAAAAALAEQVRTAEAELAAARNDHGQAVAAFSAATEAAHKLVDKKIELDDVAADADQVPALEHQLGKLRVAQEQAQNARGARATLEAEADQRALAFERLIGQALGLRTDASVMIEKADHLLTHIGESALCDRCGQTLGVEAAERAAASYRDEALKLEQQAAEIDTNASADRETITDLRRRAAAIEVPAVEDPAPVEADLARARRAAEQRATLVEQVRQLTEKTAEREQLQAHVVATAAFADGKQAALDLTKQGWRDEITLQSAVSRWRSAIHEARGLIETRQAELVRAQAELERIIAAEQKLDEHRQVIAATQERVDVLKLAERAYGRDGIPALIVESAAIPQLELEANRILGELSGATAGCRIELRTQKALKSDANALRESLDIVIVTPTGPRVYETFSGGERTRLNLALRIALARLLAHRRGAESRLLAIDEPDGLDQAGMQALATVLQGVGGDFERILLVSHHPELATAFDQTIVVVKDGERSRVDAGALAVAA